jgi:hypothetical protein
MLSGAALAAGIALGSFIVAPSLLTSPTPRSANQGLMVEGFATITVLNPDGSVASVWRGHNTLSDTTRNAIAQCASGNSSAAAGFNSCSGWTPNILIRINGQQPGVSAQASNTLTPPGCNPKVYGCTGWISEATFGPSTFTQSNCNGGCTVTLVLTLPNSYTNFDYFNTSISAKVGDSLLVSIQITVS